MIRRGGPGRPALIHPIEDRNVPDVSAAAPPLAGVRIIEFAGIGPGPFAGMMLADMGAEVIRIDRPGGGGAGPSALGADPALDFMARGRRSLALNLKAPGAAEVALALAGDEGWFGLVVGGAGAPEEGAPGWGVAWRGEESALADEDADADGGALVLAAGILIGEG